MISSSKRFVRCLSRALLGIAAAFALVTGNSQQNSRRVTKGIQGTPSPSADSAVTIDREPRANPQASQFLATRRSASARGSAPLSAASQAQLKQTYAALPLLFEPNQGQTDERVKFLSRGSGYNLFLTPSEVVLSLADPERNNTPAVKSVSSPPAPERERAVAVAIKFAGAIEHPTVVGDDLLQSKSNYILGNDSAQWRRGVSNYGKVQYRGLYPGVDAVFHGENQRLEFDFDVAAGADPNAIALEVYGARPVRIARTGDVALRIHQGREVVLGKPVVYQEIAGHRRAVSARFVVRDRNRIGFSLGPYDHSAPLIIDPTLVYSTYFGPTQSVSYPTFTANPINGVAVDASGYAYVVGTTGSVYQPIFPAFSIGGLPPIQYQASGPYEAFCQECSAVLFYYPQSIAFVAKFDTTKSGANSLIYSTYLGPMFYPLFNPNPPSIVGNPQQYEPPGWAAGTAIAVDAIGNAYVTGTVFAQVSGGARFPTTPGAVQQGNAGTTDGFISVLDPTGEQLLASTYLGGANDANANGGGTGDRIAAVALDASDNVYVTGVTDSFHMSTQCAFQPFSGGPDTLFVAKLNSSLTQLQYYTYLFGSGGYVSTVGAGKDTAKAIAVNPAGEVFVVGGAYPRTPIPSSGGSVTGILGSSNPAVPGCGFPYPNPAPVNSGFQTSPGGGTYGSYGTGSESGFLAKFNASGTQLLYLTYLGGNLSSSQGYGSEMDAVTLGSGGSAYVAGNTYETNLPATAGVVGPNAGCIPNVYNQPICSQNFLAEINPVASGPSSLTFLTYLPQTLQTATATGVALDQFGDIFVTGGTNLNVTLTNVPNMPNPNGTAASASTAQLGGGESIATYLLELNPGATQLLDSGYLGGDGVCSGSCYGVEDFPANMAIDAAGNVYLAGQVASSDFPTTTTGFQSAYIPANSDPSGFLAEVSMGPANQPKLVVTPPAANFGNVPPGQTPQITLTVSNSGQAPLLIQSVTVTGPFTLLSNSITCGGSLVGTLVGTLAPGASCTANVMFNSSSAGPYSGSLLFVDNSPQGTPDATTAGYFDQSVALTAIAPATHLLVSAPASVYSGNAFGFTVTALNGSNTTATTYTGTIHFASSDSSATLPADYTFTAADNGSHTFTTTLNTLGTQTLSANDTLVSTIAGNSGSINVVPPPATYFVVSAPSVATSGTSFLFTVTAKNDLNTTAASYTGTILFTSSDTQASLPAGYTFTPADAGTHIFLATLNTTGVQTITATDSVIATLTGTSNNIAVVAPVLNPPLQLVDNETIAVTDTELFTDVFDSESVHVTDTVFLTPLIAVTAPVAEFSAGGLGFNGQSGSQTITVSDIGQAPLTLSSATISASPQFSITQVSCTNNAGSLPTVLPSGGACNVTIGYTASATPASDSALLVFTDNAALSNLPSAPSGSSFTQSVTLSGSGANTPPPPPPPAVISLTDNEAIALKDTISFPDVFDAESITVKDQVTITVVTLQSISVSPANPTILVGASQSFTATGHYSDGSVRNLTSSVTWSSSNTAIATINGAMATGVRAGATTITATSGSVQGSTLLTVKVPFLSISAQFKSIARLPNGTLAVTVTLTNAGNITATQATPVFGLLGAGRMTLAAPALNLVPGATATVSAVFPANSGARGSKQTLLLLGDATGTNPNGSAALPAPWLVVKTGITLP